MQPWYFTMSEKNNKSIMKIVHQDHKLFVLMLTTLNGQSTKDSPFIFLFGAKTVNSLYCHKASSLEPFSYCLFGAIIVKKH